MKKNTKATPYLLYTYSKIEIESPFFSRWCLFLSFGRLFHPPFVCVFFSFLSISIRFRISFFSSLLCDNNSSKFVNIWRYLHIMKWNKFQCEKQFSVSFWQIYTMHTYTALTAHIQQTSKSVKGNLLCAWNLFLRSFVFLCIFLFLAKKIKKKTIICDLFDRYGQWKTALNRDAWLPWIQCFRFTGSERSMQCMCFFFHPGRMADLPFLHCIWNMNDLGVNSILRHFTKDPISASTTDFDFFAIFFFVAFLPFYIAFT